ncbi:MAG: 50S ribosomal protein L12 [Candidatus Woesearchaeota archaeon]
MELIYTALLLHKAGKTIDEASVKKVLDTIGVQKDEGEIKGLVAAMEGVDIDKAIKEAAIPTVAPATSEATTKKEEKKEEPKEDPEKAAAGLGALFG